MSTLMILLDIEDVLNDIRTLSLRHEMFADDMLFYVERAKSDYYALLELIYWSQSHIDDFIDLDLVDMYATIMYDLEWSK